MEERRSAKTAFEAQGHGVNLSSRKSLSVSSVEDVESFNEEKVVLRTAMGRLTVSGENLHIQNLSTESGQVAVEGKVDALFYSEADSAKDTGGFFKRMFR